MQTRNLIDEPELAWVLKALRGRLAVPPGEAFFLAGFGSSPSAAKKTAANRICSGTFPLPLTYIGNRRVVRLVDLLAALGMSEAEPIVSTEKRPGRPRKI